MLRYEAHSSKTTSQLRELVGIADVTNTEAKNATWTCNAYLYLQGLDGRHGVDNAH